MHRSETALPPLRIVEAALSKTTEALIREITCPGKEAPDWTEFEWQIAEAAAAIQGISALLANCLQWKGPKRWNEFLAEQKRQTLLRQQHILALLEEIDTRARRKRIALVALKGAALYRLGLYPAGDRPMGDIDLLGAESAAADTAQLLAEMNYAKGHCTPRHRTFIPIHPKNTRRFGEHIDHPLKVELHTRIAEPLPIVETDITALELSPAAPTGLNPYPSNAAVMRHLLLHASGNIRARALRFIQVHDIGLFAARMRSSDWHELLHTGMDTRGPWWMLAPLALAASHYPGAIPPAAIDASAPGAPRLLRRAARRHTLMDVSWSKMRIQAFPGIEWSKSPGEALRFMMSRIFPGRAMLNDLQQMDAMPTYAAAVPWYGLSHFNRIARWVFSRPPRVQAIYPVKVALGLQPP